MARCKFSEHEKITFVGWVDKALDQSLTKQNIKVGFKKTRIWPFNPKLWKTKPMSIYIVGNSNGDQGGEDHYSSYDQMAIIIYRRRGICSCRIIQNYNSSWTINHKIKPCGT